MRPESTVLIIVALHLAVLSVGLPREKCQSHQYVTLDTVGVIQCFFQTDFYGVLWYFSSDLFHNDAILSMENSIKTGKGFLTGEFDIYPNGSLIIKNVSMKHEGKYTVVKLQTLTSDAVSYSVNVSVIAKTSSSMPIIAGCDKGNVLCFQTFSDTSELSCMVYDARPLIPVEWNVRTTEGDRNIPSTLLVSNTSESFYTSRVTTIDPFVYTSLLTLLVCKADSPPGFLERTESLVLVQYERDVHPTQKPEKIYLEISSKMELTCIKTSVSYFVWQVRRSSEEVYINLLYSAIFDGYITTHIEEEDYKLQGSALLVVDSIKVSHEGLYRCIGGNGLRNAVEMYAVVVVVYPSPAHLIIEGCSLQQYCVLEVKPEGSLTCTLKKIRPQVELDFKVHRTSSELITFYEKKITVENNGDTFDISLTSKYRLIETSAIRITIECDVIRAEVEQMYLSTKLDLFFLTGLRPTEETSKKEHYVWIVAVVVSVVLITAAVSGLTISIVKRRKCSKGRTNDRNTMSDLHDNEADDETRPLKAEKCKEDKMKTFLSELKAKYQDLCNTIHPIPYIRDRLYCVDRVFVEGGIEYLVENEKIEAKGIWKKLRTYHDMLDDDQVKSVRRIVEGEPGYGKSTLTLQLAYDWYNKVPTSYLVNIDIFILLRLRQLGGISSLYTAIKRFLLPKDSKLKENDIKHILSSSSSVFVVLDGFDEYPNQEDNKHSDIINIIRREMFQNVEVILTTRPSNLPKGYTGITKRLKLTGFDDTARNQYIKKAVVGDDVKAANRIKQLLKENPVLGDLCQVPLFFVIFAHMSHESRQYQKFNSVTSFFRHMISCFHHHLENKMDDENVKKYDLFEIDHKELDKLAYEGLSGKNQKIVWGKEELCERITDNLYNLYARIGILVEEEVLDTFGDPKSKLTEQYKSRIEVRFYHKLFCEWYAAHYLSEYLSRDNVTFSLREGSEVFETPAHNANTLTYNHYPLCEDTSTTKSNHSLEYPDPFDLHYVYRFACGLNTVAANKIVAYLKTEKDTSKFAILCILEKNEKLEDSLQDVQDLCSRRIEIDYVHSMFLQRSTIQLLEIASANKISIAELSLSDCESSIDLTYMSIQIKSSLSIPVLTTLKVLSIEEDCKVITEITDFIQYSLMCIELEVLQFLNCLLPKYVQPDSLSALRLRRVKVWWGPRGHVSYSLDLASGVWERARGCGAGVMTDEDYKREAKAVTGTEN